MLDPHRREFELTQELKPLDQPKRHFFNYWDSNELEIKYLSFKEIVFSDNAHCKPIIKVNKIVDYEMKIIHMKFLSSFCIL